MPEFTVHYKYTMNGYLTLEADTKDAAAKKFDKLVETDTLFTWDPEEDCTEEDDFRVVDITEVKEEK